MPSGGGEHALPAKPPDSGAQFELQLKDLQEAYGQTRPELCAKKIRGPHGAGWSEGQARHRFERRPEQLIRTLYERLLAHSITAPLTKLFRWFGNLPFVAVCIHRIYTTILSLWPGVTTHDCSAGHDDGRLRRRGFGRPAWSSVLTMELS